MDIAKYTLIGLLLGIGALLLMRALAPRLGLIDIPDARKAHGEPVPVVGGIAIFLALCVSVLFMSEVPVGFDWLLLAGAVLIAMGLLDDRYQLRASIRMLGQGVVALIMVFGAGLVITTIGDPFFVGEISVGAFAVLFTVTVINAINMTDGMDGLAGSFSLASLLPMVLLLLVAGRWAEAGFLGALMGTLLAFLAFNFPVTWNRRVRTFMGDAGSTFLGLAIVWVGISINQGEERLISPVAGLWFIALPVHDLIASAIRSC